MTLLSFAHDTIGDRGEEVSRSPSDNVVYTCLLLAVISAILALTLGPDAAVNFTKGPVRRSEELAQENVGEVNGPATGNGKNAPRQRPRVRDVMRRIVSRVSVVVTFLAAVIGFMTFVWANFSTTTAVIVLAMLIVIYVVPALTTFVDFWTEVKGDLDSGFWKS